MIFFSIFKLMNKTTKSQKVYNFLMRKIKKTKKKKNLKHKNSKKKRPSQNLAQNMKH
jgi:hypothetical protein